MNFDRRKTLQLMGAASLIPLIGAGCSETGGVPDGMAEKIFTGGSIITMTGAGDIAEAVAVAGGKIQAVGSAAEILESFKGEGTEVIDLGGKTLLPGFIDPHAHFINALAMSTQVNVSAPPVGPANNPTEIVAELEKVAKERGFKPGELIMGYGYDENLMPDGQPLTRRALDAAFPDNPVVIMHVSLHGAVLNSAGFERFGISADMETPVGGIMLREPGSNELEGLIMETAFLPVFENLPSPSDEEVLQQIRDGQMIYAAAGVTTAHEGASYLKDIKTLKKGADAGAFFIDVIAFPFMVDFDKVLAEYPAEEWKSYDNRLKLGGLKITLDGSPQGRTAFFTTPYLNGGPAGEKNWVGEPTITADVYKAFLDKAYKLGIPVNIHANGDAAIDMLIEGHEAVAADSLDADRRTTVIHSQFARPEHLDKYVEYNLIPSFYTEHAFFFSDAHIANRGAKQTNYLSPMRDAIDKGLRPTNHTDFNVVPIDQMLVVWSAVTRRNRRGDVIGAGQRITPYEALEAITINAARQYFEEDRKGSIEPGKLADLVILDANPIDVEPDDIRDIKVVQTLKEGVSIYEMQS